MIHCPKCGEDWSEVAAIRAATKEQAATIATLRAALPCETDIWTRLETLAMSEGGTFTIFPAYALLDGGWGDWTIRYERRDGYRVGHRARYLRTFGEGPSRVQALMALAMQLLPIEGQTP